MFSKACEYAIRAEIYIALASQNSPKVSLKDIAKQIESPEAFTAKILQQLVRNKLIESQKGPSGGFWLTEELSKQIRLSQIVEAIDGDKVYQGCGLGLKECSEKQPCPIHNKFKFVRNTLREMLETTSLYELAHGLKEGAFLKI